MNLSKVLLDGSFAAALFIDSFSLVGYNSWDMSKHDKLEEKQQREFAKIIEFFADIAHDPNNSWRNWARTEIKNILWCWTAAALNSDTGAVSQSGVVKYDLDFLPATDAARKRVKHDKAKGVRHEHAVPRKVIADLIVDQNMDEEQILVLLRRCCIAALVTKHEDKKLKPRDSMPSGWKWESDDPRVRYVNAGLDKQIRSPDPR